MSESLERQFRLMLEAVSFAARAHRHHLRKDGQTPYASHVFRVCLIVRHVFGFDDQRMLMAAALHDTLEDTTTDWDDLAEHFGAEVADWVALLSKDTRQPDDRREQRYRADLANAPWQVKVCKLADIFDNLMDATHASPAQRAKVLQRARSYLQALAQPELPEPARRPYELVQQLLTECEMNPS